MQVYKQVKDNRYTSGYSYQLVDIPDYLDSDPHIYQIVDPSYLEPTVTLTTAQFDGKPKHKKYRGIRKYHLRMVRRLKGY